MIITKVRIVVICWGKKGDVMIYYRTHGREQRDFWVPAMFHFLTWIIVI